MVVIIIILIVIAIIAGYFIKTGNTFNRYEVSIEESKKNIDIAIEKRYEILTKLCQVAKKYTTHEQAVFLQLRTGSKAGTVEEANKILKEQDRVYKGLLAVGEAYPQLMSNNLYTNLMNEITNQNEYLAASKRTVNSNVSQYNQLVVSFPASIIASIKGKKQMGFLDIDVSDKKEVNLDL